MRRIFALRAFALLASLPLFLPTAASAQFAPDTSNCAKGPICGGCMTIVEHGVEEDLRKEIKYEECPGGKIYFADCICQNKDRSTNFNSAGQTYQACKALCARQDGATVAAAGIGQYKSSASVGGGSSGASAGSTNAFCFKQAECTDLKGTFEGSDLKCPAGKGRCIAPEPVLKLSSPIMGQATVTGLRNYIPLLFNYGLSISLVVAAIMYIVAGFKYVFGATINTITHAKEDMINVTVGLVLLFGAQTLLRTINPTILDLNRLTVYMINPQSFLNFNFCKDFKGPDDKTPLLGTTGSPAGSVTYDTANFDTDVGDAECNSEFYAQGFPENKCMGSKCETGKSCVPCVASLEECKGKDSKTYACVQQTIGGAIHYDGERSPKKMYLLPVCNYIQGEPFTSEKVSENMPEAYDMNLTPGTGVSGDAYYKMFADPAMLEKMRSVCDAKHGGLRGFVIGVIYNDTLSSTENITGTGKNVIGGALTGAVVGFAAPIPGGVLGGAAIGAGAAFAASIPANDVLIVTKDTCQAGSMFYGYANGTRTSFDSTDMKTAFYCGSVVNPANASLPRADGSTTGNSGLYWTIEELNDAVQGKTPPIPCNFGLSNRSAPTNPGDAFEGGCQSGWCSPGNPTCEGDVSNDEIPSYL